jgi:hypothetical protein
MQARYRQDYPGEFVILETRWKNGKKFEQREWIDNPIDNQHLSHRAACIGSNIDAKDFDYPRLQRHKGGLLSSLKLQVYGTASIAQEMRLDFTVDTHIENLLPLIESKYVEDNIVYTTSRNCIAHPGKFYLIPQAPLMCTTALPVYLAAFDGHQEIFLVGYNKNTPGEALGWEEQVARIIRAYSSTIFTLIGREENMPESWLDCPNTRIFDYRTFVTYCDVR